MSYRSKHVKNKIHKIKPKKSILRRPIFWFAILFLIVVLTGFYFVLFFSEFQVKNINILGNEKVSSEVIKDLVQKNVSKKIISFYNWSITSKSIFLVNSASIQKQILSSFPLISSVQVNKDFTQNVSIKIQERKPVAVFCSQDNQNCFFLDSAGEIFEELKDVPQDMVIVRQNVKSENFSTGENVIGKNIMDAVSKVEKSLKDNFKIDLREALVSTPVRLDVTTSENWKVYFNSDPGSDIDSQITKLDLLLNKQITPQDRKNLIYIDLRFDKAYICDNKTCAGQ